MLSELLHQILLAESTSKEDVESAIDNHSRVFINYESKFQDIANGTRVIDVYVYGISKAGNLAIRAYQPYGDTASKVPSWKMFLLDGITNWELTGQTFTEPADGFNPNGDKSMSFIYKIAKFGDEDNALKLDKDGNQNDDVFKTDTERRMERTRQQLNNPITIDQLKNKNVPNSEQPKTQQPTQKPDDTGNDDVYKTPTERSLERLRQQLDNPTKIDLSQFEKNRGNKDEIEQLRKDLGDTSEVMTINDLNQKLQAFNAQSRKDAEDDVYKTDTERNMERLRQQLDNPTKIDLSQFNRKR